MDPKLKDFIHNQVSTSCDADPEILTSYVLALLAESKSTADIKSTLKEKLQEFFEDETTGFIDRLYTYLDNSKPTDKDDGQVQPSIATRRTSIHQDAEDEDAEEEGDRSFKHRRPRHNNNDDQDLSKNDMHPNRQKRRLSHQDNTNGQNKYQRNYRPHRDDPESNDLTNSFSNYSYRGGRQQHRYHGNSGRPAWKSSRPMCKDYNEKGHCIRGDLCPYDHGKDTIAHQSSNPTGNQMMPPMMPPPNLPFNIPNVFDKDAFSPENMAMMQAAFPGMMPSPEEFMKMMMQQQPQQQQYARGGGGPMRRGRGTDVGLRGRGRGRGGYGHQMNNDRYDSSSNRQQKQRPSTTLVIDNVPPEKCQMIPINDYFKKFGNITNIQLQPRKALVQFSTRTEAEAAHASPDVIFDNRFVKVYWHKETSGDFRQATGASGLNSNSDGDGEKWKKQQSRDEGMGGGNNAPPGPPPVSDEPDPSLVAAKSAELQKLRDAKMKKRQEQMKAVLDLQKRKEQLLQQQIDEQKQLMAKLADKSLTQAQKEGLLQSLRKILSDIDTSKSNTSHVTNVTTSASPATTNSEPSNDLKEKLITLQAEAASMAISPDAYQNVHSGGYYSGGGGGGAWPPRGSSGGPIMAKRSLDNRPTKVMIKDIPETTSGEDVKKHFEQFGRVISFDKVEDGMIAHYSQRYEAEKAIARGSNLASGNFSLSWYTSPPSSSSTV